LHLSDVVIENGRLATLAGFSSRRRCWRHYMERLQGYLHHHRRRRRRRRLNVVFLYISFSLHFKYSQIILSVVEWNV
jgi:hypothetical protein